MARYRMMLAMLLLLALMSTVLDASKPPCPNACTCSPDNRKVNCSNAQLTGVPPDILPSKMTELSIAHNGLREVELGTLKGQKKLKSLNISHNSLTVLDSAEFNGLSHLEVLDVSNNAIREIEGDLCLAMPKLKVLHLGGNRLSEIPNGIRHCTFLRELHLQNNSISNVNSSAFDTLSQLTLLELQNNTITEMLPGSFKPLSHLLHLNMAGNKVSKIGKNSLKGLASLRQIDLSNNQIKRIQQKAFKHTKQLQKLFLNNNQYRKLSKVEFPNFPSSLKALHLSGNKVTQIFRKPFRPLRGLEILDLSDNKIRYVEQNSFNTLGSLISLSLSGNHLKTVPLALQSLQSVKRLNLKENPLHSIPAHSFVNLSSLLVLDLSDCNISVIYPGAFVGLDILESLSLKQNIIEHFPKDMFNFSSTLQKLDVSGNNLNFFCPSLHKMNTLRSLSMGHNPITTIPKSCFHNQQNLTKLTIQGAKVATIEDGAFEGLKNLRSLNLNNNKLETVPKHVFAPLRKECMLNLRNNPWSCDCRMYDFKKWLNKNNDKRHFGNSLRCRVKSKKGPKKITAVRSRHFECEKPSIIDKTQKYMYLPPGEDALFKCAATGVPIPTITWFRNNVEISNISSLAGRITFQHKHTLMTVASIQVEDFGQYSCIAANEKGQITETFTLDVGNIKEKPELLMITTASPIPNSSTSPFQSSTEMLPKTEASRPSVEVHVPTLPPLAKPLSAFTQRDKPESQQWHTQPITIIIIMVILGVVVIAAIVLIVLVIRVWQKMGNKKKNTAPWLEGVNGHELPYHSEPWMRAITKNYVKLVGNMRAKDLTKWLIQDGVLTLEMHEEIKAEGTVHDQNEKLLSFLRGEEAVKCLCKALKQNLARLLEVQLLPKTPDQV